MVDADPSRAGISILGLDIGGTKIASEVVTFLAGQISCDDWVHTNKVVPFTTLRTKIRNAQSPGRIALCRRF